MLAEVTAAGQAARDAGVSHIWADPGIGFGKIIDHNLSLRSNVDRFAARGLPAACTRRVIPVLRWLMHCLYRPKIGWERRLRSPDGPALMGLMWHEFTMFWLQRRLCKSGSQGYWHKGVS